MKGRQILIEPLAGGGSAAALVVGGRLQDLMIDAPDSDPGLCPETICLGRIGRPMKGLGGVMVELGGERRGFLRGSRLPAPGTALIVQVSGWTEPGKAPPVSDRIILKGHSAILTPGAGGHNIARSIRDEERRAVLRELAEAAMAGAAEDLGLIVRSSAAAAPDDAILDEIAALRAQWAEVEAGAAEGMPGIVLPAAGAGDLGWREWYQAGTQMRAAEGAIAEAGLWEEIAALLTPRVPLAGGGFMTVEPTRALVAVDVNTGGDLSPAAGLKANLAACAELPRQLRLRGLGGQIVVDFAPLAKADRRRVEGGLGAALRLDGIETAISGWTPLGNLELQRKRARRPLAELGGRIPRVG